MGKPQKAQKTQTVQIMGFLYKEECYKILGAVFEVYRNKGCGFLDEVYQECLEIELRNQTIPAVSKPHLELEYKGQLLRKTYQPDLVCYGKIILELKACKAIDDVHKAQLQNYLRATGMRVGYLVNFGSPHKATVIRIIL